jgi:hypothetical protein
MQTHSRFVQLFLFCALTLSASAQEFVIRGDVGGALGSSGPYKFGATTACFYLGHTLDAAGKHEITGSIGFFTWNESPIERGSPWAIDSTTLWIDNARFVLPRDSGSNRITSFRFADGKMALSDGSAYSSNYAAALDAYPLMLNYRFFNRAKEDRLRYFVGLGAGISRITMSNHLLSAYSDAAGGGMFGAIGGTTARWSFTSNIDAGTSVRIARHIYIDLTYTLQLFRGSTYDMYEVVYKLDDMYVQIGRASFSWHF